ncbi:MAG: hypothetical protein Tsb0015_09080 [Simkaniaceae bacterium]
MSSHINKQAGSDNQFLNQNSESSPTYDKIKIENHKKLAESFLKRGETLLLQGDMSGLQLFDVAEKLDPANPELLCQMGLSLFEMATEEDNKKILKQASRYFKKSSKLNTFSCDLWQVWGNTLYQLGKIDGEPHYFIEAKRKYQKAIDFSQNEEPDVLAHLYWDYAAVWMKIAKSSGEAFDLQKALESFETAASHLKQLPAEFWIEFGHCCLQLGKRINDLRLYLKAFNCYKNAISISISSFDGWISLANALKQLYEHTHDEDHFTGANECFSTAAQLKPRHLELFTSWADMLVSSGTRLKDSKRLQGAVEKCQKIHQYHPGHDKILGIWSEALAQLGLLKDRAPLLFEAQNKISLVIETAEDKIDLWHSYGCVLMAFAKYFNDLDFYYQAIEKFQAGLSMDRTDHKLWHKLAVANTEAAIIENDPEIFERAVKFYKLALYHQSYSSYHFDFAYHLEKYSELTGDQQILQQALYHFEQAINQQKNAIYHHPDWLFHYALALDHMGDFTDEDTYYMKASEILLHVLTVDPEYPDIHYRLALVFAHLGELTSDIHSFERALHHFRIAYGRDEENDTVILDWGLTLLNFSSIYSNPHEVEDLYKDAENKIIAAAKLGNVHAYYHLACLYSLMGKIRRAASFLEKAKVYEALPSIDDLMHDEWLENLRDTDFFKNFIAHLENH